MSVGIRYTPPYATALDAEGVSLPGARLYFYASGTATPLTTYSDIGLTIPNTNPVISDAGGLFGNIFLQDADYKVILTDAAAAQIWSADPVSGSASGASSIDTIANIAALKAFSVGPSLVGSTVYVRGYLNDNDGGQGQFLVTDQNPGADNGGTIIYSNTAGYYFVRLFTGEVFAAWFGAVVGGNYVTSIRSALSAVEQLGGSISSPLISASRPVLTLPAGVISISSTLSDDTAQNVNGVIIQGQSTILSLAAGITGFGGIGYDVTFRDIQFLNGAVGVSIKTANTDSSIISFEGNCQFINQTQSSVITDTNSNSTKIVFDDSTKWYNDNSSATLITAPTGDQIIVRGWVETGCDVSFDITDAVLFLDRILGVPLDAGGFWAQIDGVGSIWAHECRFGAESGGKTVLNVTTSAAPGYIILRDNAIFCVGPWIVLGALPKYALVCKGSNAPENTQGIALTNLNTAQKTFLFSQVTGFVDIDPWMTPLSGNQEIANLLFPSYSRDIIQSDVLLTIPINSSSYGLSHNDNHVTVTNTTDAFGNFAYSIFGNDAANDGFWSQNYSTALSSIGGYTGPVTLIVDVENVTPPFPIVANVTIGYVEKLIPVMAGKHFLTVHGYADGTNTPCIIAFFNMLNGVTVQTSGLRIIKGHVNPAQEAGTWLSVSGNAFPVGGYWMIGDRTKNLPPVSGQPTAWMNTVASTSGTWKSEGNLA